MKKYWIAKKRGQIPRVANYASSLFNLEKKGFKLTIGNLPKKYIFICKERGN